MSNRIDLTRFIALADKMAAAHDNMGLEGMGIHHVEAHSALLEAIAELKSCYEQLDAVKHEVENCSECGGHREEEGTFHYCQNYCRCEEFDASQ